MERQRKEESSGQRGQCEPRNDARARATGRNHSQICGDGSKGQSSKWQGTGLESTGYTVKGCAPPDKSLYLSYGRGVRSQRRVLNKKRGSRRFTF